MREEKKLKSYKGFMHIQCPHCGKIRTFCTKEPITHFHCFECGGNTQLEGNLTNAWVNCECGKRAKYKTNINEKMFDINCQECRQPVTVEWNNKKKIYQTVKE